MINQELYEKKKSIIDEMKKYKVYSLYSFEPDEVLTQDFVSFVQETSNERLDFDIDIYFKNHSDMFKYITTEEEADRCFDICLQFKNESLKNWSEVDHFYTLTKAIYKTTKTPYEDEFSLEKLLSLTKDDKPRFKDTYYFDEKIDDILLNKNISNIDTLFNCIKTNYVYDDYSLALNNKSLTDELKKQVLKSTFKKSKFSKAKEKFRNGMKSLNDFKLLIEITVEENPKCKNVKSDVAKLFKDIFIAKNHDDNREISNMLNIWKRNSSVNDSAARKYIRETYFEDKEFIDILKTMTKIEDYSYRTDSFLNFLKYLYRGASVDEVAKASSLNYTYSYKDLIHTMYDSIATTLEKSEKDKLLRYWLNEYKTNKSFRSLEAFYSYLPYAHREELFNYFIANHVDDSIYTMINYNEELKDFPTDFVFILQHELFKYNKDFMIPEVYKSNLGFNYIIVDSWSQKEKIDRNFKFLIYVLEGMYNNLKVSSNELLKFLYNSFFKDLAANDTIRNIADVIMQELGAASSHTRNTTFKLTPTAAKYANGVSEIEDPGKFYYIMFKSFRDGYKNLCSKLGLIDNEEVQENIQEFDNAIKTLAVIDLLS